MMSDKIPSVGRDRPFPWSCIECDADQVYPQVTDYSIVIQLEGRSYTIRIPDLAIPTCRNCGDQLFTNAADDRVTEALRAQAGLLTPEEIQRQREQLKLTQQELAEQLGVAREAFERWEAGGILQPRAIDNLLRLFFDLEPARNYLHQRSARLAPVPVPDPQAV
jgi:putative zinc finger/helix-turn-helix YgiT family protein